MKPFFIVMILNFIFVSFSFGNPCTITGLASAPQSVECEYRDGWYLKTFFNIRCENGQYVYTWSTRNAVIDEGRIVSAHLVSSAEGQPLMQFQSDRGPSIRLIPVLGRSYRGQFHYSEFSGYDHSSHCRIR